jgi:hypothetical protein
MQEITLEEALFPTTPAKILQNPTTTTPKQLGIKERREKVVALILKRFNITVIAQQLGIDRSTVYEDFEAWAKTEQATYLQVEWLQQYEQMKQDDPQTAFEALTKLMMKLLEKQAKLEVNLTQNNLEKTELNFNMDGLSEADQDAVINAGRILIKKNRGTEQSNSLH